MALNKVGGILMLVSLFLPAVLIMGPITIMLWTFGLTYWLAGPFMGLFFIVDVIGIGVTVAILILSIGCIVKEPGETKAFGAIALALIGGYYAWLFFLFPAMMVVYGVTGFIPYPFIAIFGVAIGAILNLAAS